MTIMQLDVADDIMNDLPSIFMVAPTKYCRHIALACIDWLKVLLHISLLEKSRVYGISLSG